jgi:hypothetical protein
MQLRIYFDANFESWIEEGFSGCGTDLFKELTQSLFGGTEENQLTGSEPPE